jgi:hypothetical protein
MPDSLIFDGVDDKIEFAIGGGASLGPLSFVAILKRISDSVNWHSVMTRHTSGASPVDQYFFDAGNQFILWNEFSEDSSAYTVLGTEGWVLIAHTRPSGSSAGRFHKYRWDTSAWTHQAGDTSVSIVTSVSGGKFKFGTYNNSDYGNFSLLVAGWWNSELSDANIETLIGGLSAWTNLSPVEAWRFDRTSAISAFGTSNTADETSRVGTTLDTGDAPSGWVDINVVSLQASVVGTSSTTVSVRVARRLQAAAAGVASITALLRAQRKLAAVVAGSSMITAALTSGAFKLLAAVAQGAASVLASAHPRWGLKASPQGAASVTANMRGRVLLQASVQGHATVTGRVSAGLLLTPITPGVLVLTPTEPYQSA